MKYRWLATCLALALAGGLIFAELGWAQCGGYGYGPRCQRYQAGQTGWQGGGWAVNPNCPNYSGNGYWNQSYGNYTQGAWRGRRGGRNYYYNPQTTATPLIPLNQ